MVRFWRARPPIATAQIVEHVEILAAKFVDLIDIINIHMVKRLRVDMSPNFDNNQA